MPDEFKTELDNVFKDIPLDDSDEYEYTIGGNNCKKGFIIALEIPEGESTPLKDVKNAINNIKKRKNLIHFGTFVLVLMLSSIIGGGLIFQ